MVRAAKGDEECVSGIGFPVRGRGRRCEASLLRQWVDYEIDLKGKHASKFHKQVDFFVEHATRVGGRRRRSGGPVAAGTLVRRRSNSKEIRSAPGRPSRAMKSRHAAAFSPRWSRCSRMPTDTLIHLRRLTCLHRGGAEEVLYRSASSRRYTPRRWWSCSARSYWFPEFAGALNAAALWDSLPIN
jgi:hypothetical protein